MTTIQLIGFEHSKSDRRTAAGTGVRLYGYRATDLAQRLVVVHVTESDAVSIVQVMADRPGQPLPEIEVEDNHWCYVGNVGENEALIVREDG